MRARPRSQAAGFNARTAVAGRWLAAVSVLLCQCLASVGHAQPAGTDDIAQRTISPYLYLVDADGNKVLLASNFWRRDARYDERALTRMSEVMAGLEKRGFHKDEKATIDSWDKPEADVRCYIYMEDLQSGRKSKGKPVTGTRVWCTDNGASEHDVGNSDSPKHVAQVLRYFDLYFKRAKANVKH